MNWPVFRNDSYMRAIAELLLESAKPSGSERVVAVVGGALLEEAVEKTLKHRLLDDAAVHKLFDPQSPLGNMAPQVDMLYALGAFDDATRKALKGLASVRNHFAHHTDASFDSPDKQFVKALNRLTLHEGRDCYPHHLWGPDTNNPIEPVTTRMSQFMVNLQLALIILMRDRVSHHRNSNTPRTEEEKLERWPDRFADDASNS